MRLTANFTLGEFERASMRELTPLEKQRALEFAELLQLVRVLTGPIVITSFVRTGAAIGAGPHADGRGLDIVPQDRSRYKMEVIHALLSLFADRYGENLLELDHIHISLPGTDPKYPAGKPGQTLVELPATERRTKWREGIEWTVLVAPLVLLIGAMFAIFKGGTA